MYEQRARRGNDPKQILGCLEGPESGVQACDPCAPLRPGGGTAAFEIIDVLDFMNSTFLGPWMSPNSSSFHGLVTLVARSLLNSGATSCDYFAHDGMYEGRAWVGSPVLGPAVA